MEYSSTKSNRSLRSIQVDDITQDERKDNSIIIEERENEESTKYSDQRKKSIVFPAINKTPTVKNGNNKLQVPRPTYYYSLQFQRNKLGTMSTRVIKEQVNRIRKKCHSIAAMSERAVTENSSTTDTPKHGGSYLNRMSKFKSNANTNHRYMSNGHNPDHTPFKSKIKKKKSKKAIR